MIAEKASDKKPGSKLEITKKVRDWYIIHLTFKESYILFKKRRNELFILKHHFSYSTTKIKIISKHINNPRVANVL